MNLVDVLVRVMVDEKAVWMVALSVETMVDEMDDS